jgi:hypothetical protein
MTMPVQHPEVQPRVRSSPTRSRRLGASSLLWLLALSAPTAAAPDGAPTSNDKSTTASAALASSDNTTEPKVSADEAKKKAKEHFETGLKLYEDSDYSLALIEFERAYSFVPDFRVLYNIGQVSIQLGRYAKASQALEHYLNDGGAKIPAARAASVRNDLKMLEGRTAHLRVHSNVEGADILLDDSLLSKTPVTEPLLVDAGEHRITLQKPGYVTRSQPLVLAGRDESTVEADLVEEPKAPQLPERPPLVTLAIPPQNAIVVPPPPPPPPPNEWLYVGWGATGLLAVGWAVTGIIGVRAASDLHNALNQPTNGSELQSLKNKARGWLLAADITGAAAVVTGGTTLYFTLKHPNREQPTSHAGVSGINLGLGTGTVQFSGTFEP